MSNVRRSIGILALAIVTVVGVDRLAADAAQVGAVKDGWLVLKIHSLFVPEDALSGSNIDVDVKDGMVTLQGTVPNEAARAKAIEVARKADGVKGVTDQMRLGREHPGAVERAADKTVDATKSVGSKTASGAKKAGRAIDDGWIKSKIYAQFMVDWNTILDDSDIDVDVDNNVVTLNGSVKSQQAKTKAVQIAKGTDGVKSVNDNLRVAVTR